VITARRALQALGRWNDAYAALHEAIESLNEADDGSYRVTRDFLLAVGARSRRRLRSDGPDRTAHASRTPPG
jgi:hypothetical protein